MKSIDPRTTLEAAMYDEARGLITSKQLKAAFARFGWTVDLRSGWHANKLDAFDAAGNLVTLEC